MTNPTTLAGLIQVTRSGRHATITIDGEPFPWYIVTDGVTTTVDTLDVPTVTFTVRAERVEVINALRESARMEAVEDTENGG